MSERSERDTLSRTSMKNAIRIYIYWRVSKASETLSGVYKFEMVRYIYIYICMYGGTYAIIVAHATHT